MCGRFTLTVSANIIKDYFELEDIFEVAPRYNIAPSQGVLAVRQSPEGHHELAQLRWGLIPSWMKEKDISSKMINARAETIAERPAFRSAFRKRRCLIISDGFYEWQKSADGKQPMYIHKKDNMPFAMAGVWEHWHSNEEHVLESCTIITTSANPLISKLHERMPVIFQRDQHDAWLEHREQDPDFLQAMLQPYAGKELEYYPVSPKMNNPRYDQADCISPHF